jgi:hypothetical protein
MLISSYQRKTRSAQRTCATRLSPLGDEISGTVSVYSRWGRADQVSARNPESKNIDEPHPFIILAPTSCICKGLSEIIVEGSFFYALSTPLQDCDAIGPPAMAVDPIINALITNTFICITPSRDTVVGSKPSSFRVPSLRRFRTLCAGPRFSVGTYTCVTVSGTCKSMSHL